MSAIRVWSAVVLMILIQACLDGALPEEPPDVPDCAGSTVACGQSCVDLLTDPASCGGCGVTCEADEYCSAGACSGSCAEGALACGRSCVDPLNDSAHCGGCDQPCGSGFQCVEAACLLPGSDGEGPSADPRITVFGNEFRKCGRRIVMNGANTPWHAWDDFGGDYDPSWWSNHYLELHEAGVNSSRVWITCSGEVGIDIQPDGAVLGATPAHWEALDSYFAIAGERQIYVMATLMSFDHFEEGAELRWKAWLASDEKIDSYVNNYLVPFLERYRGNPYLWSIDLMNEPDWVHERSSISFDRLRAYFARAARAIHEHSDVLVTVGMASPKYSAACVGCTPEIGDAELRRALDHEEVYLDFYSPHYYDWVGDVWGNTLHQSPAASGFDPDKPAILGEHSARGTADHTLSEDIEAALAQGWQGTMPWTSNGVDRNGGFAEVSTAAAAFQSSHPSLVFPACP